MAEYLPTVLLIEDEPAIRRFLATAFVSEGWKVLEAATAKGGARESRVSHVDLTMLDLGLPDGDGLNLLVEYRKWSTGPVIVLSARSDERDKVAALDAGADDYLTKPFGVAELLARVRATMRRRRASVATMGAKRVFGAVAVDLDARIVTKNGRRIHLTPIEYRLLTLLIAQAGRVMTQRALLNEVWGPSHVEDTHYVRVHMAHLRAKIEDQPAQPTLILTEPAVGYRLNTSPSD
jgi:two-component system KDP operon response regulator KdpE